MSASTQLNRLVQLVAELTRRDAAGEPPVPLGALAQDLGVSRAQVLADLGTLTEAQERLDGEWLDHLTIALEGDTVQVASRGPFRRPIRFTVEELVAIQVGLAGEAAGAALSAGLAAVLGPPPPAGDAVQVAPAAAPLEDAVLARARRAIDDRRLLSIRYAGERDHAGSNRVVEPHEIAYQEGRWYIVAWCRTAGAWRHFRADRVLDAALETAAFPWRDDHRPVAQSGDVFRVVEEPDEVTVRFGAGIARWLLERYPGGVRRGDGSLDVVFRVGEPAWLVRHVLQYGPEAEVLAPESYRAAMRKALGRPPV